MITLPVQDPTKSDLVFASALAPAVSRTVHDWSKRQGPATFEPWSAERMASFEDTIELQLYNNAADLKRDFSVYAIHLNSDWRKIIFSQLDDLLDLDAWDEDSLLLRVESFRTFLRFLAYAKPLRIPSLGVDHQGNPITAWIDDPRRLFVTFLPRDRVNASMIGLTTRGEEELTSWSGPVAALRETVERMGNRNCLDVDPS